ncbi:glycosyltransferase family 4 protein [Chryseobacterium gallinarum]|uniref:glycosyltransferase family 4 protein n=1 Tax=Chryseobacterium gallinarum TaxID=1324352 RepID=UPI0020254AB8|nr:glycosyltransferase family 4 protein [Chryseobacterium gallinarum]MCL8535268.1 glycosyltransferase family 4 protein [Chryseobacterium gallinarum]
MYNKKKILFVASIPEHIKAFHLPYLKWFQDNGYETHIAVNGSLALPYIDKFWQVDFERNPFKRKNFAAYRQLKKIISEENYALINCHTPMASVITRLAKKNITNSYTKLIYTAHGFHFYSGAPFINWLLYYPVEKYLTQYTDAIITINTEDYDRIRKEGSKNCEYFIVPGVGVNKKKFHAVTLNEKLELRKKNNFPENTVILIYAAEFIARKNHNFIIDIVNRNLEKFKNIKILFAGKGELDTELRNKVQKNGLGNIIEFLGFRTDIDEIYKMSDYGLSSSLQEGLPINVVEEMLCGLPVIATKERGHNELIDNRYNGFQFTINSENEFIEIIEDIQNSKIDYPTMSRNALQKAEKFELSNSLKEITQIYQKFLN